jgi:thiamine-phosphate pyrophosphorylase
MPSQFKLIVISPDQEVADEIKIVCELFECGLQLFHLRKQGRSEAEVDQYLDAIPVDFHKRIVLHSSFNLVEKYRLKGIHLNEENKMQMEKFKSNKIISASFHSIEDMEDNKFPYEYIFLSPIFDSISKPAYKGKFDLKRLEGKLSNKKIIALGGINADNIATIKQIGFSGAAVLGAIWESKDPVKEFAEIRSMIS